MPTTDVLGTLAAIDEDLRSRAQQGDGRAQALRLQLLNVLDVFDGSPMQLASSREAISSDTYLAIALVTLHSKTSATPRYRAVCHSALRILYPSAAEDLMRRLEHGKLIRTGSKHTRRFALYLLDVAYMLTMRDRFASRPHLYWTADSSPQKGI